MGLAVSQVRLLALTNRKADIELQMQINSKRKQQLTRKSTELAQEYYNRLQNTAIMYATSNGYEDVDFNYVMGETRNNEYTGAFMQDVAKGFTNGTAHKVENTMVLADSFGQVVVNDTIAKTVAKVNDDYQYKIVDGDIQKYTVNEKTSKALMQMIVDACDGSIKDENGNINGVSQTYCQALGSLYSKFTDVDGNIDETKFNQYMNYFSEMVRGYDNSNLDGGVLYCASGSDPKTESCVYYLDKAGTIPAVAVPKSGFVYQVLTVGTGKSISDKVLFYGDPPVAQESATKGIAEAMKNLVEYFAPILSAAFKNGCSTNVTRTTKNPESTFEAQFVKDVNGNTVQVMSTADSKVEINEKGVYTGGGIVVQGGDSANTASIMQFISQHVVNNMSTDSLPAFLSVVDGSGIRRYYTVDQNKNVKEFNQTTRSVSESFYSSYKVEESGNKVFKNATNVDNLQTGLKSGIYQFCIVGNVNRGTYHKNTRLNYFTRQGYVSEKMDSSKREEITAWFNVEQAAISEKETYWDTEIQNLSTELTSVNTEIESVKQLKSNAIKSVFNWGGQ